MVMKLAVMMLPVAALVSNIHPHTIHVYNVPYILLIIIVDAKSFEGILFRSRVQPQN